MIGNLSGAHLVAILAVVLLLFGAPKLPALARSLGQSMRILKQEVTASETEAAPATTTSDAPAQASSAAPAQVAEQVSAEVSAQKRDEGTSAV